MKKMPSMARIDRKNKACGIGELPKALGRWLRFAPKESHATSKTGSAMTTAATNNNVMSFGGLLGSDLKIWWISGSLP